MANLMRAIHQRAGELGLYLIAVLCAAADLIVLLAIF